jgi:hypothetical protein
VFDCVLETAFIAEEVSCDWFCMEALGLLPDKEDKRLPINGEKELFSLPLEFLAKEFCEKKELKRLKMPNLSMILLLKKEKNLKNDCKSCIYNV